MPPSITWDWMKPLLARVLTSYESPVVCKLAIYCFLKGQAGVEVVHREKARDDQVSNHKKKAGRKKKHKMPLLQTAAIKDLQLHFPWYLWTLSFKYCCHPLIPWLVLWVPWCIQKKIDRSSRKIWIHCYQVFCRNIFGPHGMRRYPKPGSLNNEVPFPSLPPYWQNASYPQNTKTGDSFVSQVSRRQNLSQETNFVCWDKFCLVLSP